MRTTLALIAGFSIVWTVSSPSSAEDFPPLFPFVISYDAPDNASSMAHLLDAPAGKHGFVRAEDGRLVTDAGPIRLNATNLTGAANFPSHHDADQTAARLARFGINCVRLHYMDAAYGNFRNEHQLGIIADDPTTQRNLDPARLDRLDYLIAAFKKHGIYVNINLHVARTWDERDGFPEQSGRPWADKGLDNFEPRMIELQREYARKLLTHVNPYTGLAYADDPCVAMVELNNENGLMRGYFSGMVDGLPSRYVDELQRQWNEWLQERYATTAALRKAWNWVDVPLGDEQIPEGSFGQPVEIDGKRWILSTGQSEATADTNHDVLKITVTREGNEYFPKLFRSLAVKKGQPYTLSFKVRQTEGSGRVQLGLAVADTVAGWRSLGLHQTIWVGRKWKALSYSFAATDDSDNAQFQLTRFEPGTYEIDEVSFQSGAKTDFDPSKSLEDRAIPIVRNKGYAPRAAVRDFYQFLVDTERNYWVGLSDYLKNELKVKSVISGTQLSYSPAFIQAELDYVDNHAYWCHPSPVNPDWRIRNLSMVNSMSCIRWMAAQRVHHKPYTVSEYNHPFPNQYGAEGQPMLRAYGRLHGWDGVFEYTYNHRLDYQPEKNIYFFSIIARTDVLAHMPACAAIYLRGDVREANSMVVAGIDRAAAFERLMVSRTIPTTIGACGFDSRLPLIHKTAVDVTGKPGTNPAKVDAIHDDQRVFVSDTGELTWNIEMPDAGYFTIDTPNTKLFSGFPEGRTIALGEVTLSIGKTRLDWATVSLVSRDATGFGESGRPANLLLTATGLCRNQGMTIQQVSDTQIRVPEPWGEAPVCVEGIPAVVTLPADHRTIRCFALNPRGDRKHDVPVQANPPGGAKIVLKPAYETVWYEIDIR